MHVIHVAKNPMEAHLVRALLADEGIESVIVNEMLQMAQGDFGLAPTVAPQVALLDLRDAERARCLVDGMLARARAESSEQTAWVCASCGEENDASFELCWQCQTPRPVLGSKGQDEAAGAS